MKFKDSDIDIDVDSVVVDGDGRVVMLVVTVVHDRINFEYCHWLILSQEKERLRKNIKVLRKKRTSDKCEFCKRICSRREGRITWG